MNQQNFFYLLVFVSCLLSGVFFAKVNNGDWLNGCFFALGLLGIGFSLMRNRKKDQ